MFEGKTLGDLAQWFVESPRLLCYVWHRWRFIGRTKRACLRCGRCEWLRYTRDGEYWTTKHE